MPDYTEKLNLPKPLGTENVNRAAHNELVDAIEAGAASQQDLDNHTADTDIHVTASKKAEWNAKETPAGAQAKADAAEQAANDYTDQQVGAIQLTADNVSIADTGGHFASTDVEGALAELFQNVSDGKLDVAAAIADMGQSADSTFTFAQLAAAIRSISNDANALTGDVLANKTFYQGGEKNTGTMPNKAGTIQRIWADGIDVTQPLPEDPNGQGEIFINPPSAGYYDLASVIRIAIRNLVAANIKKGTTVGHLNDPTKQIEGTYVTPITGNAAESQVLNGQTFYSNDAEVKRTGTMPNRGSVGTQTITTQNGQYTIPAGYHNGAGKVQATFANLTAANVKDGVNIGGVVGNVTPDYKKFPSIGNTHQPLGKFWTNTNPDGGYLFKARKDGFMWVYDVTTNPPSIKKHDFNGNLIANGFNLPSADYTRCELHEEFLLACGQSNSFPARKYNYSGTLITQYTNTWYAPNPAGLSSNGGFSYNPVHDLWASIRITSGDGRDFAVYDAAGNQKMSYATGTWYVATTCFLRPDAFIVILSNVAAYISMINSDGTHVGTWEINVKTLSNYMKGFGANNF